VNEGILLVTEKAEKGKRLYICDCAWDTMMHMSPMLAVNTAEHMTWRLAR
jgi:hypothetical protein